MIKQSSTQIFDTLHACINQNCQKSFKYLLAETFLVKIFFELCFHVNNKLKLKNDDSLKYLQSIKDYKIMRSILVHV